MTIDLTDVRALTVKPPWSHWIAHHGKTVENRGWMPPEHVDQLLIHAGKSWDRMAPFREQGLRPFTGPPASSAIVAVADLAWACNASRSTTAVVCGCGEWAQPGQCHWNLLNVRALPDPVPCAGQLGLWRPPADVLGRVAEQLRSERAA